MNALQRLHDSIPLPDKSTHRIAQQCFSDWVNGNDGRQMSTVQHFAVCPACDAEIDVEEVEHRPRIRPHRHPKSGEHCMGSNLPVPNRVVRVKVAE